MFGLGSVRKDWSTALTCLREASERGSIYGTGMLSLLYFQRALYTLASSVAYSLVVDADLRKTLMGDEPQSPTGPSNNGDLAKNAKRGFEMNERGYMRRSLTIAYFIYATCLDRGLGVKQDHAVAGAMYSRVATKLLINLRNKVISLLLYNSQKICFSNNPPFF